MLSRKTEEIHIDEYIKKLALDNSVVTSKDGMPRSIRYIFLDNNSYVSKVKTTLPVASHSCIPTHNTVCRFYIYVFPCYFQVILSSVIVTNPLFTMVLKH